MTDGTNVPKVAGAYVFMNSIKRFQEREMVRAREKCATCTLKLSAASCPGSKFFGLLV